MPYEAMRWIGSDHFGREVRLKSVRVRGAARRDWKVRAGSDRPIQTTEENRIKTNGAHFFWMRGCFLCGESPPMGPKRLWINEEGRD